MKDKLSMDDVIYSENKEEVVAPAGGISGIQTDAVQALTALGYGSTEALRAVKQVEITEETDVEDVLKQALKYMMF